MHLFHIPQGTIKNNNLHISVLNGALWGMEKVVCGIAKFLHYWTNIQRAVWESFVENKRFYNYIYTMADYCFRRSIVVKRPVLHYYLIIENAAANEILWHWFKQDKYQFASSV